MGIIEAMVLFAIGLLFGIVATVFDVLAVGTASFVAHFSLWVLVNAILAVHVGNRKKVIWWSIPFNLGYIESYYITTAASYEGYSKAMVVPLAATAVLGPLLCFALWTARQERRNAYGRFLMFLIVVATLLSSFFISGALSIFDGVICVLTIVVVLFWSARTFDVTRLSPRTGRTHVSVVDEQAEVVPQPQPEPEQRHEPEPEPMVAASVKKPRVQEPPKAQPTARKRPTKRARTPFGRKKRLPVEPTPQETPYREEATSERRQYSEPRPSRRRDVIEREVPRIEFSEEPEIVPRRTTSALGTARTARRSSRTRRV